ncbi:MAG: hypothetical protein ABIL62_16595, partial [Planctomycetota bacterium]
MQGIRESEYQEKPVAGFEKLWVWQKAHELMQWNVMKKLFEVSMVISDTLEKRKVQKGKITLIPCYPGAHNLIPC